MVKVQVNFRLPKVLVDALGDKAKAEGISSTELATRLLEKGLELPVSELSDSKLLIEKCIAENIANQLAPVQEQSAQLEKRLEEQVRQLVDEEVGKQIEKRIERHIATQLAPLIESHLAPLHSSVGQIREGIDERIIAAIQQQLKMSSQNREITKGATLLGEQVTQREQAPLLTNSGTVSESSTSGKILDGTKIGVSSVQRSTTEKLSKQEICKLLEIDSSNVNSLAGRLKPPMEGDSYIKQEAMRQWGQVWEREPGMKGKWFKISDSPASNK